MSVWNMQWSCTLLRAPIWISSLSPRSTEPHQTLASWSSRTLPISTASGATQLSAARMGAEPSSS
jgi:hypothetical protein